MKKLISILLALIMLMALAVPAMAIVYNTGNYDEITADDWTDISGDVVINDGKTLKFEDNSSLDILGDRSLTGTNVILSLSGSGHTVNFADKLSGKIDLTFSSSTDADAFAQILKKSKTTYERIDNRIIAPCSHRNTVPATVCKNCGEILNSRSGSTLSEGNMTIVVGVAALAVGLLGGFVLGRKKQKTEEI